MTMQRYGTGWSARSAAINQRRLKIEPLDVARPSHTRLGRADIETHVRVGHRLLDLALRGCEAADVDDRVVGMLRGRGHQGISELRLRERQRERVAWKRSLTDWIKSQLLIVRPRAKYLSILSAERSIRLKHYSIRTEQGASTGLSALSFSTGRSTRLLWRITRWRPF